MVFSSIIFIFCFLPCCLVGYYLLFQGDRKRQNRFLLICSLLFYAWGGVRYLFLMMVSIAFNWLFALFLENTGKKRIFLVLDIICNLSILFLFKYLSFTVSCVNTLFGQRLTIPEIALPIGISFFTFQAMSYVIDVYNGKDKALQNVLDVGLYISLFPQLVAGPIVRYSDIADQIENRKETYELFSEGVYTFCIGLAKKVVIANNVALIAEKSFLADTRSAALAWLGILAYTLQIYFDFSGYSDMAIGLGRMFGFQFNKNFDYPYISSSITEFWRRWHISMGTWFRDYVYFPLGGSRVKNRYRLIFNLFVVWLLTGLWHGANWTFVFWGLLQFIVLVFEKMSGINKLKGGLLLQSFKHIYTMIFVMLGWVFFKSDSIASALQYVKSMFGVDAVQLEYTTISLLRNHSISLILGLLFCFPVTYCFTDRIQSATMKTVARGIFSLLCFVISVIFIAKGSYNPFIYFNF